jgi:hypothetical protein
VQAHSQAVGHHGFDPGFPMVKPGNFLHDGQAEAAAAGQLAAAPEALKAFLAVIVVARITRGSGADTK